MFLISFPHQLLSQGAVAMPKDLDSKINISAGLTSFSSSIYNLFIPISRPFIMLYDLQGIWSITFLPALPLPLCQYSYFSLTHSILPAKHHLFWAPLYKRTLMNLSFRPLHLTWLSNAHESNWLILNHYIRIWDAQHGPRSQVITSSPQAAFWACCVCVDVGLSIFSEVLWWNHDDNHGSFQSLRALFQSLCQSFFTSYLSQSLNQWYAVKLVAGWLFYLTIKKKRALEFISQGTLIFTGDEITRKGWNQCCLLMTHKTGLFQILSHKLGLSSINLLTTSRHVFSWWNNMIMLMNRNEVYETDTHTK